MTASARVRSLTHSLMDTDLSFSVPFRINLKKKQQKTNSIGYIVV